MLKISYNLNGEKNIVNIKEIYECNIIENEVNKYTNRLDIEDFHATYINGESINKKFVYKNPLAIKCEISIDTLEVAEATVECHTDYAKTRLLYPCLFVGVVPCNYRNDVVASYETAYRLLCRMKKVKTAFLFNIDIDFSIFVDFLCKNGKIIDEETMQTNKKCNLARGDGEMYLVVSFQGGKTKVHNVSDFKLFPSKVV